MSNPQEEFTAPDEPVEVATPPETPETEEKSIEQQHREAIFGDSEPDDAVDAEDEGA